MLEVTVRRRRHVQEEQWLVWVEERQIQGWGGVEKLPEGAFRLGNWWIERHGRPLTREAAARTKAPATYQPRWRRHPDHPASTACPLPLRGVAAEP